MTYVSGSLCRFLRASWIWCAALWKWLAVDIPALDVVSKVARAKPKKNQKLTWVCGSPTPPTMAASGLVLGLGPVHGQNGDENVKKNVNAFVWLLGGSQTVALCRKFEFSGPENLTGRRKNL